MEHWIDAWIQYSYQILLKVANEFKCEIPDFFAENDKFFTHCRSWKTFKYVTLKNFKTFKKFLTLKNFSLRKLFNLQKFLNPQEFFPSKII